MERTYKWEHVDTPLIRNEAAVQFLGGGLTASGVQCGDGYEATWELRAAENWVTERVSVHVEGDGWGRSFKLVRSEQGVWSADTSEGGTQPEDLPSPGIVQSADLKDALDYCDLGLCPLTNTMPIRRLALLETQVPKTQLIMAWIDMPSLQVIASDQYYSSIDAKTVRYEAEHGESTSSWRSTVTEWSYTTPISHGGSDPEATLSKLRYMNDLTIAPGPGIPGGLVIVAADLTERFAKSSGPGGQGVNTTDSKSAAFR